MLMEWVSDDKYNIEWIASLSEQVTFLGPMHSIPQHPGSTQAAPSSDRSTQLWLQHPATH